MKRSLGVAVATLLLAFNMLVVPVGIANAHVGESTWRPNPDDSVTIFFQGVANDSVNLHWSVVDKPGHWLNTTDTPMVYSPQNGNFSVTIGPFSKGTTIEWVFYDVTSGHWYNLNSKEYGNWFYRVGTPIPGRELVRMSVYTDKYTYSPRDLLGVTVQVTDLQAQELDGLTINSTIYDSNSVRVLQLPVITDAKLGSLASEKFDKTLQGSKC